MHLTLTRPKALLFDWDNTLVDTWPIIHQALHDTMVQWDMTPWTLDEVKLRVGQSMRDAFPAMFGAEWEKAGDTYMAAYRGYHLQHLKSLPDVIPMLEYIRNAAPFIGVVSNKKGDNLRKEITHMGWNGYFDAIVGASDAAHDKPHTAPAVMALMHSGVTMGRDVWFIGDTTTDLECAQRGGMVGILYGDVEADNADITSHGIYRGFPFAHHARDHHALLALMQTHC